MDDPLDTLRALRDPAEGGVPRDTLGMTVRQLADALERDVDEVLNELDRLRHERYVGVETDAMGTAWYDLTEQGEARIAEAQHVAGRDATAAREAEERLL